ncbi:peptide chain release factor N(5)-glutamine methyltransferase [Magnetovibrio blakemorei]|uniref:Release factor glutamine methyltransferase n=1 Tax=Magnetovibrio blakemorei TaxID=28181 RepID=A0A1E5Q717_9PROT|nr:peptide chain release factor N(5)-glutamine methyltransferase [Magnetovibrio blakemorei]OEJ66738.1 protein-(glutamine-N5) methyltransferase, release factor-specific [Magnetovibrio blakemorei]
MSTLEDFQNLTVGQAQRVCVPLLKDAGIDDPVFEARVLLGFVLGGGPERVLADRDEQLSLAQAKALAEALSQRCRRMPMAQIVGVREFWSLAFKVTSDTLTPRPDTETLVEAVVDHCVQPPKRILDLGTGTGCIVLALLSEWPSAVGIGVDASLEALKIAEENSRTLGLVERVAFVSADWTGPDWTHALGAPFDVVVSNPPYIPALDIEGLEPDVRDFEPRAALDGGEDGLDAYRAIVAELPTLLAPGGLVGFEIGIGQADDVAALLKGAGLDVVEQRADLGGVTRVVLGHKAA